MEMVRMRFATAAFAKLQALQAAKKPDFLRNHKAHLTRLKVTQAPEVLTVNGKAEVVVQDATSYQLMVDRLHHMETLAAIQEGMASAERGELKPAAQVLDEMRAFERICQAAPTHAEKWLTSLFKAVFSLDEIPPAALLFPKQRSLAILPATCCTANGRCLPNRLSYPGGRAACACVASLRCFPRCHHRRRCGGVTSALFIRVIENLSGFQTNC
jgi:hypothetical protein